MFDALKYVLGPCFLDYEVHSRIKSWNSRLLEVSPSTNTSVLYYILLLCVSWSQPAVDCTCDVCLPVQMVGIYLARTLISDIEKVKFSY